MGAKGVEKAVTPMKESGGLRGRKVLVVEDEGMIALLLEDMLDDLGCLVAGSADSLESALELVRQTEEIDVALLDVNLAGKPAFAVADALRARDTPVIFSTGYGEAGLRPADQGAPVLRKPFRAGELATALRQALNLEV
jgi:CheY-like chemotaxis protein